MNTPIEIANRLRAIADKIDRSVKPSITKVAHDLIAVTKQMSEEIPTERVVVHRISQTSRASEIDISDYDFDIEMFKLEHPAPCVVVIKK